MYQLIDCGDQVKIERFGDYVLKRPCPQALWKLQTKHKVNAEFRLIKGDRGEWVGEVPQSWKFKHNDLTWKIDLNNYGNIGIFPEHWEYTEKLLKFFAGKEKVLSVFSYSGSSTVPLVQAGHQVTVVDSSKNAMTLYANNLEMNNLSRNGQRLMLDDAITFMEREERRKVTYDALIIDSPSYGRGIQKNQIFNIEENFIHLLYMTKKLRAPKSKALITLHSPRYTPLLLQQLAQEVMGTRVTVEETFIESFTERMLPSGYAIWVEGE
jgi:23S rRNA (cytosine1962-C5)-methyltransferase